jgi:hypothetical protein
MAKKLSYEALEERNLAIADDIIKLADENAALSQRVVELEKAMSEAGGKLLDMELETFEANTICDQTEDKWDELRFALRHFGKHDTDCLAFMFTRNGLHEACTCGWNFFATKLERAFNRPY